MDTKGGNITVDLKGQIYKGGHYYVQIKRWMQKRAL